MAKINLLTLLTLICFSCKKEGDYLVDAASNIPTRFSGYCPSGNTFCTR